MRSIVKAVSAVLAVSTFTVQAQRIGVSSVPLQTFDDPGMPAKEFRILRTTYEPGGRNPRHYHPSHVVFYVLEGEGTWQEDGKESVNLRAGESLHVRPGTIHAHWNASKTDRLIFLEYVIVEKGQRSTVPMPQQ